jgi:beta-phosphoglucomutase-like phosphatase (HAD superfamily)
MNKIEVPAHIKGLIFDCDGTLVDSMPLHMKAWEHSIRLQGGPWDHEFFFSKKGMSEKAIAQLYNRRFGLAFNPEAVVRTKHEYFQAHATECMPIPHVVDIVLKYRGVLPMAVASGGTKENTNFQLEAIRIRDCFKAILTADDPIQPKPAPDIFLEAARQIGIPPEKCQVFEDGDLGLEAARAAGMLPTDVR